MNLKLLYDFHGMHANAGNALRIWTYRSKLYIAVYKSYLMHYLNTDR